jgi:hypothetical protein
LPLSLIRWSPPLTSLLPCLRMTSALRAVASTATYEILGFEVLLRSESRFARLVLSAPATAPLFGFHLPSYVSRLPVRRPVRLCCVGAGLVRLG